MASIPGLHKGLKIPAQGKNVGMPYRKAVESRKEVQKEQRGNYGAGVFNVEDNTVEIREEKAIVRLRRQEDHMVRGKMSRNTEEKI